MYLYVSITILAKNNYERKGYKQTKLQRFIQHTIEVSLIEIISKTFLYRYIFLPSIENNVK